MMMSGHSILKVPHNVMNFSSCCCSWSEAPTTGDGLRHFAHQESGKFYNGTTLEDIHGDRKSDVNGIHGEISDVDQLNKNLC